MVTGVRWMPFGALAVTLAFVSTAVLSAEVHETWADNLFETFQDPMDTFHLDNSDITAVPRALSGSFLPIATSALFDALRHCAENKDAPRLARLQPTMGFSIGESGALAVLLSQISS